MDDRPIISPPQRGAPPKCLEDLRDSRRAEALRANLRRRKVGAKSAAAKDG